MLRSRTSRREESLDAETVEPVAIRDAAPNPEQEALLADSIGLALLVVLDRLTPAERLAFVLHDMFAVSFEEISSIVGRSPDAARQLASRARRRVQGTEKVSKTDLGEQRQVVTAFLKALREGDFAGLITVLDPDVVVHIDEAAGRPGAPREIRGAHNFAKGAVTFSQMAHQVEPMLINGAVGLAWVPDGKLSRVLAFSIKDGKIAQVDIIADAARLENLNLAVISA